MLPVLYPNDVLENLHIFCHRRDYNLVQIPRWKLELDKKRNGQLYGSVTALLDEHSPLDLILQTKVCEDGYIINFYLMNVPTPNKWVDKGY